MCIAGYIARIIGPYRVHVAVPWPCVASGGMGYDLGELRIKTALCLCHATPGIMERSPEFDFASLLAAARSLGSLPVLRKWLDRLFLVYMLSLVKWLVWESLEGAGVDLAGRLCWPCSQTTSHCQATTSIPRISTSAWCPLLTIKTFILRPTSWDNVLIWGQHLRRPRHELPRDWPAPHPRSEPEREGELL